MTYKILPIKPPSEYDGPLSDIARVILDSGYRCEGMRQPEMAVNLLFAEVNYNRTYAGLNGRKITGLWDAIYAHWATWTRVNDIDVTDASNDVERPQRINVAPCIYWEQDRLSRSLIWQEVYDRTLRGLGDGSTGDNGIFAALQFAISIKNGEEFTNAELSHHAHNVHGRGRSNGAADTRWTLDIYRHSSLFDRRQDHKHQCFYWVPKEYLPAARQALFDWLGGKQHQ